MLLTPKDIVAILDLVHKRQQPLPGYVPAAILMIFFNKRNRAHLVYIRRTQNMSLHSGQIAFPGGKIDPHDSSSKVAAFRETSEEIGVDTNRLIYLGEMGLFETITSRYDAAAHLVWSPRPQYKINQAEVAEVVEIPIEHLLQQFRPNLDFSNYHERMYLNFNYQPADSPNIANLWGLTARITHHFLQGLSEYQRHRN
jgi:8-oxo-dGTP pyrophosphatase MutT (NUDIX family)